MRNILELYNIHKGVEQVFILGCSPDLNSFDRSIVGKNDLVIGLNSAFLLKEVDYIFFCCERFYRKHLADIEKSMVSKVITSTNFLQIKNKKQYQYTPSKMFWDKLNRRLTVGKSVLVPALNFAINLRPKKIILFGVSLVDNSHWYAKDSREFPRNQEIILRVRAMRNFFGVENVFVHDKKSLLVTTGVFNLWNG